MSGKYIVCDAELFWGITSAPIAAIIEYLEVDHSKSIKVVTNNVGNLATELTDGKSHIVYSRPNLEIEEGDILMLCSEDIYIDAKEMYHLKPVELTKPCDSLSEGAKSPAQEILSAAIAVQAERGQEYDQGKEERNIGRVVSAFNAIHGTTLTEAQGWHFMALLKAVRLFSTETYHPDSAIDFVSYSSLVGEAKSKEEANG